MERSLRHPLIGPGAGRYFLYMRSYFNGQVSQQEYSRLHLSRSQQEAYRQTPPCWALMAFSYAS